MARKSFGMVDFILRWLFAQILVLATFNPTDWNYYRWVTGGALNDNLPLALFVGVVLFVGYVIFVRATMRSIGMFGIALVLILAGTLLWVLVDGGLVSLESVNVVTWIGLICVGLILGLGMSWTHVRRKLSGQIDVDDVDD